mgnify:CR=1 FL=1
MNLREKIYQRTHLREVKHTTLNPYGPGVVRIHLVPPRPQNDLAPSVAILNGKDILPINSSWTILLSEFIDQINKYNGHEITKEDLRIVRDRTLTEVHKIYPKTKKERLQRDLSIIIETLCNVAYGETPKIDIPYMTICEYAQYMNAPHRMDLMISSMSKNGVWHCNQKCINCYAAGQHNAIVSEISTEEWKNIIDKCRKAYIPQLTFTGGEPTMRNDLVELIDYSRWFVTRLNTNGQLLSKELCKQLYAASLDSIQITLYSSKEEEHEQLIGDCYGAFEKTVQGIKNALAAGLNVSVNTPLCKVNSNYVETLKFLHELGVEYVSCSGIIFTGNARNTAAKMQQMSENDLYSVLKAATEYCKENHMEIAFTSPGLISEERLRKLDIEVPTCGACMSNMAIAPNGDVVPCQSWLNENSSLGNMLTDSWKKIWNAPLCLNTREFAAKLEYKCPLRQGF